MRRWDAGFLEEKGMKRIRVFLDETLKVIMEAEEHLGMRLFLLFTGQYRDIDIDTIDTIYDVLETPVEGDLGIVLFSNGGSGNQAYLIGRFLQENVKGKLLFIIPRWAKSAATILSCSGDEIVMTRIAELGPIDPVIYLYKARRYVPALSILELFRVLPRLNIPGDILKEILDKLPIEEIGDYNRLLQHSISLTESLLEKRMYKGKAEEAMRVAEKLASFKEHGAPITIYDAGEIGLKARPADTDLEKLLVKLHRLYTDEILWLENSVLQGIEEPVEIIIPEKRGVIFTRNFAPGL